MITLVLILIAQLLRNQLCIANECVVSHLIMSSNSNRLQPVSLVVLYTVLII